jgi:hypothetical protein
LLRNSLSVFDVPKHRALLPKLDKLIGICLSSYIP